LQKQILQYLASPLQWPLVRERACAHQVYPLLYRNLRELGFPGVPPTVQAELKSAYLANALRNQLFAEELARLLKLLGEAGIPVGRHPGAIILWRSRCPGLLRHRCSGAAGKSSASDQPDFGPMATEANSTTLFSQNSYGAMAGITMLSARIGASHSCSNCIGNWYRIPGEIRTPCRTFGSGLVAKLSSERPRFP
jgi:hypothetical protein